MEAKPALLEGPRLRLEPLERRHFEGLSRFSLQEEIWRYYPFSVRNEDNLRLLLEMLVSGRESGTLLPFATVLRESGEIVGGTSFLNIDRKHYRAEIGYTWIAPQWQRTFVNSEAKFLMLEHAFETMSCNRVELKTDALNARSRAAILRLGAREEGTLRSHYLVAGGRLRDSVYFSILASEWPAVKERLSRNVQS